VRRPAVFFDRDNTLIASDGYLGDPSKVVLVNGAAEAVARVRRLGFATVVVSNQSGVARGLFDEDAVRAVNAQVDAALRAANPAAVIDRHEFCPYHPQAVIERYRQESELRKPRPGMILNAAGELELDLRSSWLIGDAPRDIEAGKAAGCHTILFHDPSLPASHAAAEEGPVQPDFIASTLGEAIDHIERSMAGAAPASSPARSDSTATARNNLPAAQPGTNQDLLREILHELRRHREQPPVDFSISRLFAGIVQVVAVAVLFLAYLYRNDAAVEQYLLVAIFLQVMTIALLLMSRQQ
jgi:D,D-heptose 1,7-bisphosphate phosphatase